MLEQVGGEDVEREVSWGMVPWCHGSPGDGAGRWRLAAMAIQAPNCRELPLLEQRRRGEGALAASWHTA